MYKKLINIVDDQINGRDMYPQSKNAIISTKTYNNCVENNEDICCKHGRCLYDFLKHNKNGTINPNYPCPRGKTCWHQQPKYESKSEPSCNSANHTFHTLKGYEDCVHDLLLENDNLKMENDNLKMELERMFDPPHCPYGPDCGCGGGNYCGCGVGGNCGYI